MIEMPAYQASSIPADSSSEMDGTMRSTFDRPPPRIRVGVVIASFLLVGLVGFVDGRTSAYIAFSIFYMIPIFLGTWFGNRATGIAVAVASAVAGLGADLWPMGAQPLYAITNLVLRLILFIGAAWFISLLQGAMVRDKAVAVREREVAEHLRQLNGMKDELMRSVVSDARAPLGDIYARVVTLGFDMPTLSMGESREVLNEIADASRRLSSLVNTLIDQEHLAQPSPEADPATSALTATN